MSYDLHVVRTTHWLDADTNPITKKDVESLISADADLSWSEDYVDMRVDGIVTRFYLIEWKGDSIFWWYKNEIRFNSPEENNQIKLLEIAKTLNAYVVGDDGEHYRLVQGEDGKSSVKWFQPMQATTDSKQQAGAPTKKPWYKLW